jgi:hypothetical protein
MLPTLQIPFQSLHCILMLHALKQGLLQLLHPSQLFLLACKSVHFHKLMQILVLCVFCTLVLVPFTV